MKSTDFIRESGIDQEITKAQAQPGSPVTPKTPSQVVPRINQGINFLGQAIAQGANKQLGPGVGNQMTGQQAWAQAGKQTGVTKYQGVAAPAVGSDQPITYVQGKVDPQVAAYLIKAAGNQPLKQATGNPNIDNIFKAARLLK